MKTLKLLIGIILILGLFLPSTLIASSAGTITGTISLYKTKVKTAGAKSAKDVIIYLEKVGDNDFTAPKEHVMIDQQGLTFIPHVTAIQKGTTIEFLNNDNDNHNVYCLMDSDGAEMDLGTWKPGEMKTHKFEKADVITALCKLHLEMAAYIVVLDNPYFTTAEFDETSQTASYTILHVPPGTYTINVWHKKLKLKLGTGQVTVEAGKSTRFDAQITKSKYAQ